MNVEHHFESKSADFEPTWSNSPSLTYPNEYDRKKILYTHHLFDLAKFEFIEAIKQFDLHNHSFFLFSNAYDAIRTPLWGYHQY